VEVVDQLDALSLSSLSDADLGGVGPSSGAGSRGAVTRWAFQIPLGLLRFCLLDDADMAEL